MMEPQENLLEPAIDAKEIQQKIENGEDIIYEDKTIIGDLNLSLFKVPKLYLGVSELKSEGQNLCRALAERGNFITSNISIRNCNFMGNVNFENSIFYKSVKFEKCIFRKNVFFNCSRFNGPADFNQTYFKEDADFDNTCFRYYIRFDRSYFHKRAEFGFAVFMARACHPFGYKSVIFYKTTFDSLANFENAEFWEYADFEFSKFNLGVLFRKARFHQNASFENASIKEHAIFEGAVFGRYLCNIAEGANFKGASFQGDINFSASKFYNRAMFQRSKFDGDASFIGAKFFEHLILRSTKIDRMHFRGIYLSHNSLIFLVDAEFKKLLVRWDLIKDHLDQGVFDSAINDDAVYLQLIKGFKEQGLFDDADSCYLDLRDKKKLNFSKVKDIDGFKYLLNDLISWHFYGHGVDYLRPLYTSLWVMFISFLFFVIYHSVTEYSQNMQLVNVNGDQVYSLIIKSLYSCLIAFISNPRVGDGLFDPLNWIGILERLLGIILVSTFLVALAKKTIR